MVKKVSKKPAKKAVAKTPKKRGPKKIIINWDDVNKLCAMQCTKLEILHFVGCSEETFDTRIKEDHGMKFREYFKLKRVAGFTSLRKAQYEKAIKSKDTAMLIWLGKQLLGQKDKWEQTVEHKTSIGDIFAKMLQDPKKAPIIIEAAESLALPGADDS